MQNDAAPHLVVDQLNIYCEDIDPGYAVLVDAPWGAGKTFAIKRWAELRADAVYFSLYGISTSAQFEVCLLEAIFDNEKSLKTPKLAKVIEGISRRVYGVSLGIGDLYRRVALKSAPRVIVIDDLERTNLGVTEAFGLINTLLEHNGKSVILIAHQEELLAKWSDTNQPYLRVREKVIGRIFPFSPDVRSALHSFIMSQGARSFWGKVKNSLGARKAISYPLLLDAESQFIASVFERLGSKNLRLLRQSLRDFARIFPVLFDLVGDDREKIRMVLGSYLALSVSFHEGRGFDERALHQEVSWERYERRANGSEGEEPEKEPIELLREIFSGEVAVQLDGTIISKEMAIRSIARGDFSSDMVRTELLKSPFLVPSKDNAWRTLWQWMHNRPAMVELALRDVSESLRLLEIRDPVVILHVFCILRSMEDRGVLLPFEKTVEEQFKQYVASLVEIDQSLLVRPKSKYSVSIFEMNETGLAFAKEDGDFFRMASAFLEEVMDRNFWYQLKSGSEVILNRLRTDPRGFLRSLDNRGREGDDPNYAYLPVMGFTDPKVILDEILELGPSISSTFIGTMQRRIQRLEAVELEYRGCEWPDERRWMQEFSRHLKERSMKFKNSILSAQLSALSKFAESVLISPEKPADQ